MSDLLKFVKTTTGRLFIRASDISVIESLEDGRHASRLILRCGRSFEVLKDAEHNANRVNEALPG